VGLFGGSGDDADENMSIDGVVPRRILATENDRADWISIDSHVSWIDLVTGQARKFRYHPVMSLHHVYLLLDGHPLKHTIS
jgi:hypothetical protein